MADIEIIFGEHAYTVEYEITKAKGVCESCGQEKPDVEKFQVEYIVRQQDPLDGKDIDAESDLGKKIVKIAQWEIIAEVMCSDCLSEMNY